MEALRSGVMVLLITSVSYAIPTLTFQGEAVDANNYKVVLSAHDPEGWDINHVDVTVEGSLLQEWVSDGGSGALPTEFAAVGQMDDTDSHFYMQPAMGLISMGEDKAPGGVGSGWGTMLEAEYSLSTGVQNLDILQAIFPISQSLTFNVNLGTDGGSPLTVSLPYIVPEPASAALVLLGSCLLITRRSRRV